MVISNGLFRVTGYSAGYLGKANTPSVNARIVFAGTDSQCYIGTTYIYAGSGLLYDFSEWPTKAISGSKAPFYGSTLDFKTGSVIEFDPRGLIVYKRRLEAANIAKISQPIACQYSGSTLVLPEDVTTAMNASAAQVSGFSTHISGPYLYLDYNRPTVENTFVVPEGTEGNVPDVPYGTWTTAATNILAAVLSTALNGTVAITNGTYAAEYDMSANRAVTFKAVDYDAETGDEKAGEVTIGYAFFGTGVANPTDSPDINSITLAKGTFKCTGSRDGVFVDYRSFGGGWGTWANERFIVTGEDTVLDTLGKSLYIGYSFCGSRIIVKNGATVKASSMYLGLYGHGGGCGAYIIDGGTYNCSGSARIGEQSDNNYVVVSNGTYKTKDFSLGKAGANHNEALEIGGATPSVSCTRDFMAYGNSSVSFNIAEVPLTGYAKVPLQASDNLALNEDSSLKIVGADKLLARLVEAGQTNVKLTLATAANAMTISAEQIQAAQAQLPADCQIYLDGKALKLRVGKSTGFIIMAQ